MKYTICTCTSFWFVAVRLTVDDAKELRLSGNCERHTILCANKNANKCGRYSNTLLVSLNNRIYFREHQPGYGDSACLEVSDRIRAMALSSFNFVVPEPQTQASKAVIIPLNPISLPGSVDDSSTELSPVRAIDLVQTFLNGSLSPQPHPRISLALPEDIERTAGMPPSFCGPKVEIGNL
jgi:hypothetical protein